MNLQHRRAPGARRVLKDCALTEGMRDSSAGEMGGRRATGAEVVPLGELLCSPGASHGGWASTGGFGQSPWSSPLGVGGWKAAPKSSVSRARLGEGRSKRLISSFIFSVIQNASSG